ncbi:mitochondrial dicarboxylate transporter [Aspergillus chevalieri]|uniref:Mitochondrial dicarboxylate transporter n=1 Tax=Aspergillus chevalieri TaxID=182096 RepID=A0A7R7VP41_ASPCH|nr:mitochondrial dicarboxylate transporter [Aspergillus chevalieri]BCR88243.1 mitochondrial dicarboxylate transporter [Aspergillus chevalieri]
MATSAKSEVSQSVRAPAAGKVHYPFWFGGSASCFAAGVTHPLDLVKVYIA